MLRWMVALSLLGSILAIPMPSLTEHGNVLIFCPLAPPPGVAAPAKVGVWPWNSAVAWPDAGYVPARGAYFEGQTEDYWMYIHAFDLQGGAPALEHHVLAKNLETGFTSDIILRGELTDGAEFGLVASLTAKAYSWVTGNSVESEPWYSHGAYVSYTVTSRVRTGTSLLPTMANGRFPFPHSASLDPQIFTVSFDTPIYEVEDLAFSMPLLAAVDASRCEGVFVEQVTFGSMEIDVFEWVTFAWERMSGCWWTKPCFYKSY